MFEWINDIDVTNQGYVLIISLDYLKENTPKLI